MVDLLVLAVIAGLRNGDAAPSSHFHQPYARSAEITYRALLSLVRSCGNLTNGRTTLCWVRRAGLAADAGAADGMVRHGLGSERLVTVLFAQLRGAKLLYRLLYALNQFLE
jgi:hypothetical protein